MRFDKSLGKDNSVGIRERADQCESAAEARMTTASAAIGRRTFVKTVAVTAAAAVLTRTASAAVPVEQQSQGIAEIFMDLDRTRKWNSSAGDTWDPFWADNDCLYAFNCDGRGFGAKPMNLAFNQLSGKDADSLVGEQVNPMEEYGHANQKEADGATWKACGQECIDGVFYAFVSRNTYGNDGHDPLTRQLAVNSSLIKSMDRGKTWTRSAQQNYANPMWPGPKFGAPFFVHYGRNGGQESADGAGDYVYACSTNGFWNNGDSLILGRVKRSLLPKLNSADWEYWAGGDGTQDANWSAELSRARPILDRPAKCGQTPITYVRELGIYLLISWYNTETMTKWFQPNEMRYDFYQASHPWGPWTLVGSQSDRFLAPPYHMYGPSICARFQRMVGNDVEVSLFTSGFPFDDAPSSPYKMWRVPLLLRKKALPSFRFVNAASAEVHYHGLWFDWRTEEGAADGRAPRATQTGGSWTELTFTGTGVSYLAEKSQGLGEVEIFIDGERQAKKSLALEDFSVFWGVTVFSVQGLSAGKHAIRIVNSGEKRINVEGFRVFA